MDIINILKILCFLVKQLFLKFDRINYSVCFNLALQ